MSDEDVDVRLKVKEIIKQAPSRNMVGLCFLTSLFDHHGRWWFLTYLKPSGGVSSPLSYKLLYTAGVSSPSHEKLSVLGEINLRFITWYHKFYWRYVFLKPKQNKS